MENEHKMDAIDTIDEPSSMAETQQDSPYIHAATSDNTRIAYQGDIEDFLKKGGTLPANAEQIEAYLKCCAFDYNPRTLTRRLTALRQWHKLKGFNDPTESELVKKTMRGIARLHGKPREQAAAIRLSDLDRLINYLNQQQDIFSIRNRALLLLGFFGAFRRSELVTLTWSQIQFEPDGMVIKLTRSKTDQTGEGAQIVIPFGNDTRCPVRGLIEWRQASRCVEGWIFRRISKSGKVLDQAIGSRHWNYLIRELAIKAGLKNAKQISSHSLRRGFATEASRLGASMSAIQRHGRWRSTKIVFEYIEAGRQFTDSAVNVLFDFK